MLSDPVWKEMKSQENEWVVGKGPGIGAALTIKHVALEPRVQTNRALFQSCDVPQGEFTPFYSGIFH